MRVREYPRENISTVDLGETMNEIQAVFFLSTVFLFFLLDFRRSLVFRWEECKVGRICSLHCP